MRHTGGGKFECAGAFLAGGSYRTIFTKPNKENS